jgi:hypothetical protein
MKTFSHCPKCKNPMRNESCGGPPDERWRLVCDKYLDHDILAVTSVGYDNLLSYLYIAIRMGKRKKDRIYAYWNFEDKYLKIMEGWLGKSFFPSADTIPYFEPDMARYNELIKKMRIYLTFS